MVGSHNEKIFFHYIFQNREYVDLIKDRFFETGVIRDLFNVAKEFFDKYKIAPTQKQMEELVSLKSLDEKISKEKIDLIYKVNLDDYGDTWLRENVETWIEYKNLETSVVDLVNYMQVTKVDSGNVRDVVTTAKSIITEPNSISFNFDGGLDFFNPAAHIQPVSETFSTGFNHLDLVTGGGYSAKTLWCFIGRAKIGKCSVGDTKIRIRNKKTKEIYEISMKEFHEMIYNKFI